MRATLGLVQCYRPRWAAFPLLLGLPRLVQPGPPQIGRAPTDRHRLAFAECAAVTDYLIGFALGALTAAAVMWSTYREFEKAYARLATDERRYFEAWLDTLDELHREKDRHARPTLSRDDADNPGANL